MCDTGASCHLTNSLEGMSDMVKSDCQVRISSGKQLNLNIDNIKHMVTVYKDHTVVQPKIKKTWKPIVYTA